MSGGKSAFAPSMVSYIFVAAASWFAPGRRYTAIAPAGFPSSRPNDV